MNNQIWKQSETEFITKNYDTHGPSWCAERLNFRTLDAIRHKATRLNLPRYCPNWTQREVKLIENNYEFHGLAWCAKQMPNRTKGAIHKKAKLLGLTKKQPSSWSQEEIKYLKKNYQRLGLKECSYNLDRTYFAIRTKTRKLGLTDPSKTKKRTIAYRRTDLGNYVHVSRLRVKGEPKIRW